MTSFRRKFTKLHKKYHENELDLEIEQLWEMVWDEVMLEAVGTDALTNQKNYMKAVKITDLNDGFGKKGELDHSRYLLKSRR